MENELKPCPWCGELPSAYAALTPGWVIGCTNIYHCQARPLFAVTFATEAEAVAAWNTRKSGHEGKRLDCKGALDSPTKTGLCNKCFEAWLDIHAQKGRCNHRE